MGALALLLLIAHPVLLAAGSEWALLWRLDAPWFVQLGKVTLFLLVTHVVLAICRFVLRMEYQKWRRVHNVLALLILPLGFVHSWAAGGDLTLAPVRVLWVWLLMFAAIAYFWHRVVQPRWVSGWRYRVTDVSREARDVWTIKLEPPPGSTRYDYLPGQFHFLTLQRPGMPSEEHHWTISSSPTQPGFVASTIKESGDFTQTIGRTQIGDTVWVEGPFGRFSYLLHPGESDLVFIAGGVGITPLMSMLRHMRDTATERRVLLIYASSTPADILFRDELDEMAANQKPALKVVHVISNAPDDWAGERGRLDDACLKRLCADAMAKAFYICAPRPLADLVLRSLRQRRVPPGRIHFERFSL
jgi:predicted ferric reductase